MLIVNVFVKNDLFNKLFFALTFFYFCRFKVLTKRGNSRADIDIPESLRSCWKFMEVKVPVACDCPFKL